MEQLLDESEYREAWFDGHGDLVFSDEPVYEVSGEPLPLEKGGTSTVEGAAARYEPVPV
ncbi:hypothetical protein G3I44_14270 [Halogeometricum borinquense]|uniref:Uncharacterized protein n=1 Tax=Halogeometricum borinquense TaxID=60847 RepID=A0A6C0ULV6_9EURY|nr:hypothetical protein [Halogeometricum borinquense]QIB75351.1 hypothetical protein G3I44_14270 [Halogeometricum borinquense]